jgi:hypothetical protein
MYWDSFLSILRSATKDENFAFCSLIFDIQNSIMYLLSRLKVRLARLQDVFI